ncbi:hypothetical protein A9Q93_09560 [Nonlabens dokdonensis]|uniref:DUF1684 domain-containing protein n=1 Tax=Nonlabens dokdonensis TaxID=328515 RepID=A0A1Z8ARW8_9FLAO|nr:DUF1684 domain-containing protein [Nonlabens dokdonensis]OUS13047.1 hypothetical protein A9Q93_09560 [Nonlabens dokdonensis]
MKNIFLAVFLITSTAAVAQDYKKESIDYRQKLSQEYKSGENNVLTAREKKNFGYLNFYDFDPEFVVEARFEPLDNTEELKLKTSTTRIASYVKYGYLHFTLKGKKCKLLVLSSPSLKDDPEYYNYLSVFFTDETNGDGSYKKGRYMELRSPLSDKVVLNFNNTYNPYCAYSERFSCAVPPKENHLPLPVKAGVKKGFKSFRKF